MKELEREVKELPSGQRDTQAGERVFRPGGARPPTEVLRDFIDEHRATYGVEPICKVLQIAPSGYRGQAALVRDPSRCCARALRDEALVPRIEQVWNGNHHLYGADKFWRQLAREGTTVARCTVERLMKRSGLRGVVRGKVVRTTVSDSKAPCPLDRVNRQFRAERPNQLWVSWSSSFGRPDKGTLNSIGRRRVPVRSGWAIDIPTSNAAALGCRSW